MRLLTRTVGIRPVNAGGSCSVTCSRQEGFETNTYVRCKSTKTRFVTTFVSSKTRSKSADGAEATSTTSTYPNADLPRYRNGTHQRAYIRPRAETLPPGVGDCVTEGVSVVPHYVSFSTAYVVPDATNSTTIALDEPLYDFYSKNGILNQTKSCIAGCVSPIAQTSVAALVPGPEPTPDAVSADAKHVCGIALTNLEAARAAQNADCGSRGETASTHAGGYSARRRSPAGK